MFSRFSRFSPSWNLSPFSLCVSAFRGPEASGFAPVKRHADCGDGRHAASPPFHCRGAAASSWYVFSLKKTKKTWLLSFLHYKIMSLAYSFSTVNDMHYLLLCQTGTGKSFWKLGCQTLRDVASAPALPCRPHHPAATTRGTLCHLPALPGPHARLSRSR